MLVMSNQVNFFTQILLFQAATGSLLLLPRSESHNYRYAIEH
jgi:hypothetical protein